MAAPILILSNLSYLQCLLLQPLIECYKKLKERGGTVSLRLTDTWLRRYQVGAFVLWICAVLCFLSHSFLTLIPYTRFVLGSCETCRMSSPTWTECILLHFFPFEHFGYSEWSTVNMQQWCLPAKTAPGRFWSVCGNCFPVIQKIPQTLPM